MADKGKKGDLPETNWKLPKLEEQSQQLRMKGYFVNGDLERARKQVGRALHRGGGE
jgi:hypothetical protein